MGNGVSPRYPLEIEAFLESGLGTPVSSDIHAVVAETSSIPSSNVVPLVTSPSPTAPATGRVALADPEDAALSTLPSEASHKGKVTVCEFALFVIPNLIFLNGIIEYSAFTLF